MPAQRLWIALAALGLAATACGPGDDADGTTALAPSSNNAVADDDATAADDGAADDGAADDSSGGGGTAASDDDGTDDADTASLEGDEPAADEPAPEPVSVEQAAANADANIDSLASSDDVRLIEVLDVSTGNATSLAQAVDGDRPVLVWFWAPH